MKISVGLNLLACAGSLLVWGGSASLGATPETDQEQTIKCRSVPSEVRTAFQKAYPNATISGCSKEVEEGRTAYEISSTDGKTRRDVLFYPDGTLIVVEETIAAGAIPEPVRQAVSQKFPDYAIELAEKVTREAVVTYEFRLRHRGKLVEVAFDTNGKEVTP